MQRGLSTSVDVADDSAPVVEDSAVKSDDVAVMVDDCASVLSILNSWLWRIKALQHVVVRLVYISREIGPTQK